MFYYMPVKILSETNCIANHKGELQKLGTKALIVTGRSSSRKNGSLRDTTEALESLGIPYLVFDEIEENPSVETVMKAKEAGLRFGADFVIGIGGGSPLDASKAISMMMKNPEENSDALYDKTKSLAAYPVASVPTTAGTGSEATPYSILTQHSRRTKQSLPHKIFPQVAFVDERYLKSVPHHILVDTAVDTLAHLIESYINAKHTSYSEMLSERGLYLWGRYVKAILMQKETSAEDRRVLFEASTIGGMAISHTGTSLPHALSYKLTYELGLAHGHAVGIFVPNYIRVCPDKKLTARILELLGFTDADEFDRYLKEVFTPVQIDKALLEASAGSVFANKGKLANCPFAVSEETMEQMMEGLPF